MSTTLQAFGRELPGTLVFDYPAVPALAAHLHSLLATPAAASHLIIPASLAAPLPASSSQGAPAGPALVAVTIASRMPALLLASAAASSAAAPAGSDAVKTTGLQRWDLDALRDGAHPLRARFGGYIAGVEAFDAAAFGIMPPEAQLMDPQQRLLMEVCFFLQSCLHRCCAWL